MKIAASRSLWPPTSRSAAAVSSAVFRTLALAPINHRRRSANTARLPPHQLLPGLATRHEHLVSSSHRRAIKLSARSTGREAPRAHRIRSSFRPQAPPQAPARQRVWSPCRLGASRSIISHRPAIVGGVGRATCLRNKSRLVTRRVIVLRLNFNFNFTLRYRAPARLAAAAAASPTDPFTLLSAACRSHAGPRSILKRLEAAAGVRADPN